jgi:hypothetical protein
MLTLKRAFKYRQRVQRDHEDFDVFDGDRCIGRRMEGRAHRRTERARLGDSSHRQAW